MTTPPGAPAQCQPTCRPSWPVIETARSFQGTPYKYGGTTRLGMDCSGLLYESFAAIDVNIPRSSNEQAVWGDAREAPGSAARGFGIFRSFTGQ